MDQFDSRDELTPQVRTMQIIVAALFLGCFFFLVIAVATNLDQKPVIDLTVIACIALVFAFSTLAIRAFLPGIVVAQGRKKILESQYQSEQTAQEGNVPAAISAWEKEVDEAQSLAGLYQTKTIIGGALLEGPTFFLLISYLAEQSLISLIAAIILMLFLIASIPTKSRVQTWIEDQIRLLHEERH